MNHNKTKLDWSDYYLEFLNWIDLITILSLTFFSNLMLTSFIAFFHKPWDIMHIVDAYTSCIQCLLFDASFLNHVVERLLN